jgi:hypothetical protein
MLNWESFNLDRLKLPFVDMLLCWLVEKGFWIFEVFFETSLWPDGRRLFHTWGLLPLGWGWCSYICLGLGLGISLSRCFNQRDLTRGIWCSLDGWEVLLHAGIPEPLDTSNAATNLLGDLCGCARFLWLLRSRHSTLPLIIWLQRYGRLDLAFVHGWPSAFEICSPFLRAAASHGVITFVRGIPISSWHDASRLFKLESELF